jgi:hypothetical protein
MIGCISYYVVLITYRKFVFDGRKLTPASV